MRNNGTALFGGTFDPIHYGHLRLALAASRECGLERLIFMPNYISPFKMDRKVTPGGVRCEMVRTLLGYDPAFAVSDDEIRRSGPSYTYDTLMRFRETHGVSVAFIIGFDSVMTIDTWYRGEDLIRTFPLITGRRPDTKDEDGFRKIRQYREELGADITVLELEPFDASSTEIRERIRSGLSVGHLIPPEVERFIEEHELYRD